VATVIASGVEPAPGLAPPYRFTLGDAEMVVLSDGPLDLGPPDVAFKGAPSEELRRSLERNFLPADGITIAMNILFASLKGKRIIFETGIGTSRLFGNGGGRLQDNLRHARIDPASIDAVVCSHPHPDHVGGLCDDQGRPRFPNASIHVAQNDVRDWTDEEHLGSPLDIAIRIARANLLPLRDRLVFFKDGEEFLPGVQALSAPGHTAEHSCFRLCSNGETLFLIGDLAHHSVLLLEDPLMNFYADLDQRKAARTRRETLDMLANTRTRLFACHFPWPGLGHVAVQGEGFRYLPDEIRW
jgi:glyoxylase-like metal-dependent hydrolase (beta-lactamase superfamily II)